MRDLIDRQDALNQITAIDTSIIPYVSAREYVDELKNYVIKIIEALPSAEPERTAKVEDYGGCQRCSACDNPVFEDDEFCSGCGSKLDWSDDEDAG